jgi:hypothetical protein
MTLPLWPEKTPVILGFLSDRRKTLSAASRQLPARDIGNKGIWCGFGHQAASNS